MSDESTGIHSGSCSVCGADLFLLLNWNGHRINKTKVCYDCFVKLETDPVMLDISMPQKRLLEFT